MFDSKKRGLTILAALMLGGCASTQNSRFGGTPDSRTIAVVGDRPMPATVGEPGGQVSAREVEPEPRRSAVTRISGRVLDQQGQPVPDATVRLADGGAKGGRDIQATTDASGAFTLGGLRSGSDYTLVAEFEDGRDVRIGRTRAKTSETGVEINLMAKDDGSTASQTPASVKPGRVKPISNRGADPEVESDQSRINREDMDIPGGDTGTGKPRVSNPEPAVGWRNPNGGTTRTARKPGDEVESVATSDPSSRSRRGKVTPPLEYDDDGEDPLPAAKESSGDSTEPKATPTRRKPAPRPMAPAANDDDDSSPRPNNRPLGDRRGSGPPAMPNFASPELASGATSPEALPTDPLLALLAGPGPSHSMEVVGSGPPKLAEPPPSPGQTSNAAPPTIPAPQPVFASTEPVKISEPEGPYNPFALVAANDPVPAPSANLAPQPREPEPVPAPEAPTTPTATASPLPRKTWGELSAQQAKAPVSKPTKATAFLARFKQPGGADAKKDVAVASVDYDPKTRKLTDFTLPDLQGNPVRFQDFEADYVLLDFWGTQYKQCLDSIPHLVELQKKYGPTRLKVVGIACEKGTSNARKAQVDDFTRKLGINYAVLLSDMTTSCPVQQALGVRYYPTMVLLDRQGNVVWEAAGATPANHYRLDALLAKSLKPATARR